MRKFFVKICKCNTSVHYEAINNEIVVSFEQPAENQLNQVVFSNGIIIEQNGFSDEDVAYYKRFYKNNIEHIQDLAKEDM